MFGPKTVKSSQHDARNPRDGKCPAPVKRGGNACGKKLRSGQGTCGSIACETWAMRDDLGV